METEEFPKKILIVESNDADAMLLTDLIAVVNESTQILRADSLIAAQNKIESDLPDCILSDLYLPDASGFDAIQKLLEIAPDIPIIVVTNGKERSVALEALQLGAEDCLVKGEIDVELMLRTIRYAKQRKASERSRRAEFANHALEINDNVVQGLVVAQHSLQATDESRAKTAIQQTLKAAQELVSRSLAETRLPSGEVDPVQLRHKRAAPNLNPTIDIRKPISARDRAEKMSVFLCDDVADLRMFISKAINAQGDMQVIGEAEDGLAGALGIIELQPDVAIIDLSLPRLSGLELIQQVRPELPNVKIIVFSGLPSAEAASEAINAGADRYIQKGVELNELISVVRDVASLVTD